MKVVFHCKLENGAVIEDPFCFRQRVDKGILFDVFNGWKRLISGGYGIKIRLATYDIEG